MRKSMLLLATLLMLGMMAAPAAAHNLTVEPKGQGAGPQDVWVGSPLFDGQDDPHNGLIPGGPEGENLMAPAHDRGLNSACESQEGNPSAADIRGPVPTTCHHGP